MLRRECASIPLGEGEGTLRTEKTIERGRRCVLTQQCDSNALDPMRIGVYNALQNFFFSSPKTSTPSVTASALLSLITWTRALCRLLSATTANFLPLISAASTSAEWARSRIVRPPPRRPPRRRLLYPASRIPGISLQYCGLHSRRRSINWRFLHRSSRAWTLNMSAFMIP